MKDNSKKLTFNLDEAFEIAEQIERNGVEFYRQAAKIVKSKEIAQLLSDLMDQEAAHVKTFRQLRTNLVVDGVKVENYDEDEVVAGYLKAVAGRYVFNKGQSAKEMLSGNESAVDILDMAVGKEADSIILYVGIVDAMHADADKKKIQLVIREEQKHFAELSELLAAEKKR